TPSNAGGARTPADGPLALRPARPRDFASGTAGQKGRAMADRTRASIQIGAPAAAVMAVIADLPAYPEWTGEVKKAEVLATDPETGRAARVRLSIDSGALRDRQVLA